MRCQPDRSPTPPALVPRRRAALLSFLLAVAALSALGPRARSQTWSDIHLHDYQAILEAAHMSEQSYHRFQPTTSPSPVGAANGAPWRPLTPPPTSASGLDYQVWQRTRPDHSVERMVVFVGTEDLARDMTTNISQGLRGPRNESQYQEALAVARHHIAEADSRGDLTVSFAGHSLGGGLAQYVSLETGARAYAFDAAPISWTSLTQHRRAKGAMAENNLFNVRMSGDVVSGLPGRQHGRIIDLPPPRPIALADQKQWHHMQTLTTSLERLRPTPGPRTVSMPMRALHPGPSLRTLPAVARHLEQASEAAALALDALTMHAPGAQLSTAASHLTNAANTTAAALEAGASRIRDPWLAPASADQLRWLKTASRLHGVADAIAKDMDLSRHGELSVLRSSTVEAIARIGLDEGVDHLVSSLQQGGRLSKRAVPFGAVDLLTASARQMRDGRADVDTITYYLDGVNSIAWGSLGMVVGRGDVKVAKAFEAFGSSAAQAGRDLTSSLFTRGFAAARGQPGTLEAMWRDANSARMARDIDPIAFQDMFKSVNLRNQGISQSRLRALDQEYDVLRQRVAATAPSPRHLVAVSDPGVDMSRRVASDISASVQLAGRSSGPVVVAGAGPAADHLADVARAQHGVDRVIRAPPALSSAALRDLARRQRADTILQVAAPGGSHAPVTSPRSFGGPGLRPAELATARVGGVLLSGSASVLGRVGSTFSLILDGADRAMEVSEIRRFVTALWATYFSSEGPGISIDPIGPGIDRHLVRYIGHVVNSDLGRVMRDADYLMKQWAVGSSRPELPGYASPDDIAGRLGRTTVGHSSRFWFYPSDMVYRRSDDMLLFESGRMILGTEYVEGGRGTDPANERWASWFTDHYDTIAERYTVFAELFDYARHVTLARHMKDEQVPMLWYLLLNKDLVITEDSIGTVAALVAESRHFHNVTVEGGVDLVPSDAPVRYVVDGPAMDALARAWRAPGRPARASRDPAAPSAEVADAPWTLLGSEALGLEGGSAAGDVFQTDIALRVAGRPHLELARHYDPDREAASGLGPGWHVMTPYRLRAVDSADVSYAGARIPARLELTHLLTGSEERLDFSPDHFDAAAYVPQEDVASATLGVFPLTDGSYRLVDRLGSEFHFDAGGRLEAMLLTDDYTVHYGYETLTAAVSDEAYALQALGSAEVEAGPMVVPRDVVVSIRRGATERDEFFVFDEADPSGRLRYLSLDADAPRGRYLAVMTDGSFRLVDPRGWHVSFDGSGRGTQLTADVVSTLSQDDHQVAFQHEYAHGAFRVTSATLSCEATEPPLQTLEYRYGWDTRLSAVLRDDEPRQQIVYDDLVNRVATR